MSQSPGFLVFLICSQSQDSLAFSDELRTNLEFPVDSEMSRKEDLTMDTVEQLPGSEAKTD